VNLKIFPQFIAIVCKFNLSFVEVIISRVVNTSSLAGKFEGRSGPAQLTPLPSITLTKVLFGFLANLFGADNSFYSETPASSYVRRGDLFLCSTAKVF
jgi:hypothetical protein